MLSALLIQGAPALAQKDSSGPLVTGEFRDMPAVSFLLTLEKNTLYHFYFNKADLDSIRIDIAAKNEPLFKLLARAFEHTGIVFSSDREKHIFITHNTVVNFSLADDLFDDLPRRQMTTVKNDTLTAVTDQLLTENKTAKATLENKLYVIGEKTKGPLAPGKATIAGYLHDAKTGEPVIGASVLLWNHGVQREAIARSVVIDRASLAAFIISEFIAVGGSCFATEWGYACAFLFFMVVIFIRPQGLFGGKA